MKRGLEYKSVSVARPAWKKCLLLFSDAREAFDEIKQERTIIPSFLLLFGALVVSQLIVLIVQTIQISSSSVPELLPRIITSVVLINFVGSLALPFGIALIMHPFVLLVRGTGGIMNTFKVVAYSLAPLAIMQLIPLVGSLFFMVTLLLTGYGLARVHNLSQLRASFAVAIPFLIIYLAFIFIGYNLVLWYGGAA